MASSHLWKLILINWLFDWHQQVQHLHDINLCQRQQYLRTAGWRWWLWSQGMARWIHVSRQRWSKYQCVRSLVLWGYERYVFCRIFRASNVCHFHHDDSDWWFDIKWRSLLYSVLSFENLSDSIWTIGASIWCMVGVQRRMVHHDVDWWLCGSDCPFTMDCQWQFYGECERRGIDHSWSHWLHSISTIPGGQWIHRLWLCPIELW